MRYTMTILEKDYEKLRAVTLEMPHCEGAAYLVCGISVTDKETRFLVREVIPVRAEHYLVREPDRLSIASASYVAAAKRAGLDKAALFFVHSHPGGYPDFSPQDDAEEPKLAAFFRARIPDKPHGMAIVIGGGGVLGRVSTAQGWRPLERIRVVGNRFRLLGPDLDQPGSFTPEFFDRQVRAFGPDVQRMLARLHVGIVGAGGTGSPVREQLVRLGVGKVSLFDGDAFEATNVNRVYGSMTEDEGRNKAEIAGREANRVGLGTEVHVFGNHITEEATARRLRECDIVFNCTDRHAPRGILTQLSLRYLIPIIDTAVLIKSEEGTIRGVFGRVTTLLPGEACLFCRRRISAEAIRLETLSPQERQALADEDYAPELEGPAPAVIPFTTAVAAQAVTELLHRLTGFMGSERQSSEVLLFLDRTDFKRNRRSPDPDCLCMISANWGRGDSRHFLGLMWPEPASAGELSL